MGSWLAEELAKIPPLKLVIVDNLFAGSQANLFAAKKLMPSLKVYVEDASDYWTMREIICTEKIDTVFALATVCLPFSLETPAWTSRAIYELALCLCQLAKEGFIERLIHISSSEAYGSAYYIPMDESHPLRPETPYAAAKASADFLVQSYWRTFGINAMIVRPFNIYGPRQNDGDYCGVIPAMLKRMNRGESPIINGDGKQTRDWTYVTEAVWGILAAADCDTPWRGVVNVGSGHSTSVLELFKMLAPIVGFEGKETYDAPRPADVRKHQADISLLQSETGFMPIISLEQGLHLTWHWYKLRWTNR